MSKRKCRRKKIVAPPHSNKNRETIGLLSAISVVSARLARNLARLEMQRGELNDEQQNAVSQNARQSDTV